MVQEEKQELEFDIRKDPYNYMSRLREMEADGLIFRTVVPETPPRVEYRLTDIGRSLVPLLNAVYDWGWHDMKRKGLPIDALGEMWHGYRERDPELMQHPYKEKK